MFFLSLTSASGQDMIHIASENERRIFMDIKNYMLEQLKALSAIPSPTGMTDQASEYVIKELTRLGFKPERLPKGTVICELGGEGHPLLLSAHVDTLGAMVRSIKSNGALRYSRIGGFNDNAIENENVLIHTFSGKTYTGTVQSIHASRHVYGDRTAEARSDELLQVVVDEMTASKEETEALGIAPGDFISFDPRTQITESGYIKSRFLDDKAASAILLAIAKSVASGELTPCRKVSVAFTVYEEVGHGASFLYNRDIEDMLAVDMGCIGDDLTCREHQVSICAKDAVGPYDFSFTHELISRARELALDYAVDVYPGYSSDTATALKAGLDARFALCGTGVYASHGYERTHINGMMATFNLISDTVQRLFSI